MSSFPRHETLPGATSRIGSRFNTRRARLGSADKHRVHDVVVGHDADILAVLIDDRRHMSELTGHQMQRVRQGCRPGNMNDGFGFL